MGVCACWYSVVPTLSNVRNACLTGYGRHQIRDAVWHTDDTSAYHNLPRSYKRSFLMHTRDLVMVGKAHSALKHVLSGTLSNTKIRLQLGKAGT